MNILCLFSCHSEIKRILKLFFKHVYIPPLIFYGANDCLTLNPDVLRGFAEICTDNFPYTVILCNTYFILKFLINRYCLLIWRF